MKKNCFSCEFCFPAPDGIDSSLGCICAGGDKLPDGRCTYGMPIEEVCSFFPHGCLDWELSFSAFCYLKDNPSEVLE